SIHRTPERLRRQSVDDVAGATLVLSGCGRMAREDLCPACALGNAGRIKRTGDGESLKVRQTGHLRSNGNCRIEDGVFDQPVVILNRTVELCHEGGRKTTLPCFYTSSERTVVCIALLNGWIDRNQRNALAVD